MSFFRHSWAVVRAVAEADNLTVFVDHGGPAYQIKRKLMFWNSVIGGLVLAKKTVGMRLDGRVIDFDIIPRYTKVWGGNFRAVLDAFLTSSEFRGGTDFDEVVAYFERLKMAFPTHQHRAIVLTLGEFDQNQVAVIPEGMKLVKLP